jgi:hypothetical protein
MSVPPDQILSAINELRKELNYSINGVQQALSAHAETMNRALLAQSERNATFADRLRVENLTMAVEDKSRDIKDNTQRLAELDARTKASETHYEALETHYETLALSVKDQLGIVMQRLDGLTTSQVSEEDRQWLMRSRRSGDQRRETITVVTRQVLGWLSILLVLAFLVLLGTGHWPTHLPGS